MPSLNCADGTLSWLTLVGIGEDGVDGLSPQAAEAVQNATLVFGGARHLDLARPLLTGEAQVWPTPFERAIGAVLERRGTPTCVLASGDPMLFGVGASLAAHLGAGEMHVLPAPSTFSLAAAQMGWPLQHVETVSLHGRAEEALLPLLHPGRRVMALTSDGAAPSRIAGMIVGAGFGASRIIVLEALGGPRERMRAALAEDFKLADVDPLNLLAIEIAGSVDARIIPLGAGRDEALFDHDGQITKREVRALALALLSPRRGEHLWDVGAGSGSVGIEWMLFHPSMRATAIEPRADRLERIHANARAMGTPGLMVVQGAVPEALSGLPPPQAIFVGGGATAPGVMDALIAALPSGGRIVANAVTLETEALLVEYRARLGGSLTRLEVSRAGEVGRFTSWRPALPVTLWASTKP